MAYTREYVKENAKQKAIDVWRQLATTGHRPDLVIGCDTVVTLDDQIFEKPKDADDAIRILSRLSANKHVVYTGVALVTHGSSEAIFLRGPHSSAFAVIAGRQSATNVSTIRDKNMDASSLCYTG